MRQMFDARAEVPVINALFIQPTYWCAMQCKDCYVKAHQPAGQQVSMDEMALLFKKFYYGVEAQCNQITISMDTLPLWTEKSISDKKYLWMIGFANLIRNTQLDNRRYEDTPEVHMTFSGVYSISQYLTHRSDLLASVDMVSISTIQVQDLDLIDDLRRSFPKIKINWNHMSPEHISGGSKKTHLEYVEKILSKVDSCYLILQKTPLGADRDLFSVVRDNKRMLHDLRYFKLLQSGIGSYKFMVDGCMKDVVNFQHEGYGCSSSISRFQVWPDGSVSGCPYAIKGDTPPASTATGIIQNIRKAREVYDFSRCHLPSTYRSLLGSTT